VPVQLEPVASFEEARDVWDALALRAANPFGTRAWAEAWWREYGGGRRLALRLARASDGRPAALLPLFRADRGPLPLLRFLGHGAADQLGPLCAPEDASLAAEALRRAATELPAHGLLLAERLPAGGEVARRLGGVSLRREATPELRIDGQNWDAWLSGRSRNFRDQARRMERRLARAHELRFRLADGATLDDDLGVLFDLHDRRWEADGGSDAFDPRRRALHRAFAARALEHGWLRLWVAEVDGVAGAAWYGFRYAGRDWYYQFGRDPRWDAFRLGFVLLVHTIRDAFESGVDVYHFGLGPEPYKERFASGDPGLTTVAIGRPRTARLAARGVAGLRRLPAGGRQVAGGAG
jgi:CelD/BcsL family acetyltransferase involved in cellulose biosynthesis